MMQLALADYTPPLEADEPQEPDSLWRAVLAVMQDGRHWTTWDLGDAVRRRLGQHHTDEAIAAARRTLRRPARGGHRVSKVRVGEGQTYAYRIEGRR